MLKILKNDHSVHQIGLHLVWCTKYRHPVLVNGVDVVVKRVIGEACGQYNWTCHSVEVMPDHVHLFIQVSPTDTPTEVVKIIKALTAIAVFDLFPKLKGNKFWGSRLWSRGTYYGTTGNVSQEIIVKYIENQKRTLTSSG